MEWETVIGLEIHAQLATQSKIFSGAATAYGAEANVQACAVDLGLPGVLPVINEAVVKMAIKFGLAIEADIPEYSIFARKNYFYPDLPKGYQISQYELPIVSNGQIDIPLEDGTLKTIGITRAHLEEDAGKSVHEGFGNLTGIDLNRAGTPLIEIVSEPDMRSAHEAVTYMRKIHSIVRYLEICDGNMQEGSFRCDANVSIRPKGETELGTRTELKNLNSFRFIEQAINYEIERQIDVIESGDEVVQETRLYDPNKNETRSMRSKEEANDYRYFPEPDLLPVHIEKETIEEIKQQLPELPDQKYNKYLNDHRLSKYNSILMSSTIEMATYYEETNKITNAPKLTANTIMNLVVPDLNREDKNISESSVTPEMLGEIILLIIDGTISNKLSKKVYEAVRDGKGRAKEVVASEELEQITDSGAIEKLVDEVIADSPAQVEQYQKSPPEKQGKLIGYFVGQVMKKSQGKANPQQVNKLLEEKLIDMKMERRELYTPIFHIDTNMINARGKLPAMTQLEKWAEEEIILINMSNTSFCEAQEGNNISRTKKALSQIFTLTDENITASDATYQKVASVLFPDGIKDKNQRNDVVIVCEAIKWNAILVTNDGGSKKQPGGILGNSHKLKDFVQIMRDTEAVDFINSKITRRDEINKKISEHAGEVLPEWTGKDNA